MIPFGDEQPRRSEEKGPFVFRLYVVDEGPGSARAIANLSAICKNHLPDNHQIEIVDLLQDPRRVLSDHILATPTLIKLSPAPVRKIIGDLGEEAKVLLALGLQQRTTWDKAMKPGSEILVSCADRIVWVRVEGNGSSTNSTALRDFAKEMIHRDAREFIVDLCNCPAMDSTFMGTLAGISLWLGELGEGCLSVVNLNERNAESLCSLGLDQLFNVRVSAIKKDGQALPIPLEEDRTARAQTMLEAHEALIKTAPENLPKFKDVIQYLEEELHLSK
jgi:anti-anti-sigma regulatory factor